MAKFENKPCYSDKYIKALQWVATHYNCQIHNDGEPYLSHLLAVSSLVWELGGTECEAIAALLHDILEDLQSVSLAQILHEFGGIVACYVDAVSEDKSLPKVERKLKYIKTIAAEQTPEQLISLADKLHTLRYYDNEQYGDAELLEFYEGLLTVYRWESFPQWVEAEFRTRVCRLRHYSERIEKIQRQSQIEKNKDRRKQLLLQLENRYSGIAWKITNFKNPTATAPIDDAIIEQVVVIQQGEHHYHFLGLLDTGDWVEKNGGLELLSDWLYQDVYLDIPEEPSQTTLGADGVPIDWYRVALVEQGEINITHPLIEQALKHYVGSDNILNLSKGVFICKDVLPLFKRYARECVLFIKRLGIESEGG